MDSLKKHVETLITVRLNECDPYGIAHHSNYFIWFELGRFDYAKAVGYSMDMTGQSDYTYITLNTKCSFIHSVSYHDKIIVKTKMKTPLIFSEFIFIQEIFNESNAQIAAKCITKNAKYSNEKKRIILLKEDKSIDRSLI